MKEKSGGWFCKAEGSQLTQDLVFFEFLAEVAMFLPVIHIGLILALCHSLIPNCAALKFPKLEYAIVSAENHFPPFTIVTVRLIFVFFLPTKQLSNFTF